jgi:hypothetical protein
MVALNNSNSYAFAYDPIKFAKILWPDVYFYSKQREIIYSVVEDDETLCVAGNELGKDFIAGFLVVYFFLTRGFNPKTRIPYPCRIVTTSAKDDHLRVLWGEIRNFVQTAKYPLTSDKGGPLIMKNQEIESLYQSGPLKGEKCPKSYVKGMVASSETMAALQGHHVPDVGDGIPKTFAVFDECSSVPDDYKRMINTWAKRKLMIGNAWECHNFFRHGIEGNPKTGDPGGNKPRKNGKGYHRRVIRIEATDSPNVRLGLAQEGSGKEPTGEVLVPGVKTWNQYQTDLATMDEVQICVSLRARFYKGTGVMMFPEHWIQECNRVAKAIRWEQRQAESMGVDTGEGVANTVWTVGDYKGIIKQISRKTPKTNEIIWDTIDLIKEYNVPPEKVLFDRGGGGKEHADRLRELGYDVQTIAFGESLTPDPETGIVPTEERMKRKEERYTYFNRRAQMYMQARSLMNPDRHDGESPYGIPLEYAELIRQLSPIPLTRDSEGRVKMIPKSRQGQKRKNGELTLEDLLGCSPDEADSFVLMVHGLLQETRVIEAGGL